MRFDLLVWISVWWMCLSFLSSSVFFSIVLSFSLRLSECSLGIFGLVFTFTIKIWKQMVLNCIPRFITRIRKSSQSPAIHLNRLLNSFKHSFKLCWIVVSLPLIPHLSIFIFKSYQRFKNMFNVYWWGRGRNACYFIKSIENKTNIIKTYFKIISV